MRPSTLMTLVLGAVLQATAQTGDPAQAAAVFQKLEDIPTSVERFNVLNPPDVRW